MGHFLAAPPQQDAGDGQFGEIIRKADQMLAKHHKHVVSTVLHLDIGSILMCIFAHFLQYFPWKRAQNNWSKLFLMVETPIAVPLYKRYTCLVRLNFEIVFWTAISMWFFEGCLPDYWLPFFILRRDFPSKSQTSSLVWDIEKWKLKQEVQLDIW